MTKKLKCKIKDGKILQEGVFRDFSAINADNQEIGSAFGAVLKTNKKFLWLENLQVTPECREKGVGAELLNQVEMEAKDSNADIVYVFPGVPDKEKSPIALEAIEKFYEKNGYKPCNAPKDVATITEDGLRKRGMCKKLETFGKKL